MTAGQAQKPNPRDRPRFLAKPWRRRSWVIFYRNRSALKAYGRQSRTIERTIVQIRTLQVSEKRALCIGFAYGCHWEQHLRPDNRFRYCRRLTGSSSGSSFFNFAVSVTLNVLIFTATDFCSEWRARAPRRKPSEGCFFEPRLLASHKVCPNSISALFCLHVYHL